ncbi:carbohydrate sulfotransferase 8-like [Lethenteron reissneri]|uniref:carbohydrate sulfotransferase 8-like n=1 Tax=Lethenteron reissneri TaxID=7753 RepID=UPI002AB7246F|nr:carbohydrate sulfotransferase 8-like [Lethenteron reissneri]
MESNKVFLLLVVCGMALLVVFLDIHLFTAESLTRPSALTPRIKEQRITQEERFATLFRVCRQLKKSHNKSTLLPPVNLRLDVLTRLYVSDRYSLVYCEVPKAGCTNWKRVLLTMAGNANLSRVLSQNDVHVIKNYTKLSQFDAAGQRSRLDGYTVMMFVREPMERIVSAYRDKFLHENEYYQLYGRTIMKHYRKNSTNVPLAKGDYVTFPELVRFILDPKRPLWQDVHWLPAHHLCQPCLLRYDFLGKVETVRHDAAALLARVRAPGSLAYTQTPSGRSTATVTDQYLAQLSPEMRQKIYEFYFEDYMLFGYPLPSEANLKPI